MTTKGVEWGEIKGPMSWYEASQQDDKSFLSHLEIIEEGLIKWIYLCCGTEEATL